MILWMVSILEKSKFPHNNCNSLTQAVVISILFTIEMASPKASGGARTAGPAGTVRQRRTGGGTSGGGGSGGGRSARTTTAASSAGMWRFYTDDSPGIKIGPVPVLIMSLVFIASVFVLHIWGKWARSR